jgi:two-component sensor histidine kinase/low affinity Fe/Cu permease
MHYLLENEKLCMYCVYKRMAFIDDTGNLLIDVGQKDAPWTRYESWKEFLEPEGAEPELLVSETRGQPLETIISAPCFFKGEYKGQILAWISQDIVFKHFIIEDCAYSKQINFMYYNNTSRPYFQVAKNKSFPLIERSLAAKTAEQPYYFKTNDEGGNKTDMMAICMPVDGMPFTVVTVLPVSEVFGKSTPLKLLITMGALALIIVIGWLVTSKINTSNIILDTKFKEELKRKKEVEEKNLQLEQEIAKRKKVEKELRQYQDHLENMVEKRTCELKSEIVYRKQAEEALQKSLKEKEALLKEIYHRVKNNMPIVSSLLNLQSKNVTDEKALEMLRESQGRIRSMALIHEKLYQSDDLSSIDFAKYINTLTINLFNIYRVNSGVIGFTVDAKDVSFDIETAIPCGLIINELVTNALKHAFPKGRKGNINISLHELEKNKFRLSVKDNGIGIPKDKDILNAGTLGLRLVMNLSKQINGTVKMDGTNGTSFEITFKRNEAAKIS